MRLLLAVFLCVLTITVKAAVVPEALLPWQDWVLKDEPNRGCLNSYDREEKAHCQFYGIIEFELSPTQSEFKFKLKRNNEGFSTLPGQMGAWPSEVKVNGQEALVVEINRKPAVFLPKGDFDISGRIRWQTMPVYLAVPPSALKHLVNGKGKAQFILDKLWLDRPKSTPQSQASIDMEVFRKLSDSIPMTLETVLQLTVSGKARELDLGDVLGPNQEMMDVRSSLPIQFNGNTLRVQVKAGRWQIHLQSRLSEQVASFKALSTSELWPKQEFWAFEANRENRFVEVQGVKAIEPTQTNMPTQWHSFPSYLLDANSIMTLSEIRRGQVDTESDKLTLMRHMWLDFSGKGMLVQDNIDGLLNSNWRMELPSPFEIGNIKLNNEARLITVNDSNEPGVEIRNGGISLEALSYLPASIQSIPVSGWGRGFDRVQAVLHLPPGWQLLGTRGVDISNESLIEQWDLLSLFILFILVGSFYQLFGFWWGALSFLSFGLCLHNLGELIFGFFPVIVLLALVRGLKSSKYEKRLSRMYQFALLAFGLALVPFIVSQFQYSLYPQLTRPDYTPELRAPQLAEEIMLESSVPRKMSMDVQATMQAAPVEPPSLDLDAKIQTGPSVPKWYFQKANLEWSGPVSEAQTMTLYLIPRWLSSLMHAFSAILLIILLAPFVWHKRLFNRDIKASPLAQSMLLLVLIPFVSTDLYAFTPDETLLNELKVELLKPSACLPQCAFVDSANVELTAETMQLKMRVHALEMVTVPLPFNEKAWHINELTLNGEAHTGLKQNDKLFVALEKGSHDLQLSGRLEGMDFVLPFPMGPHRLELKGSKWLLDGTKDGYLLKDFIEVKSLSESLKAMKTGVQVTPFTLVERHLEFNNDWFMTTTVRRKAPKLGQLQLQVPLLPFEKPISENLEIKDNSVFVQLNARQQSYQWRSKLDKVGNLELLAVKNPSFSEQWSLEANEKWHIKSDGLPLLQQQDKRGKWNPSWRPWPGEHLDLEIQSLDGLNGPTMTIDKVNLKIAPSQSITAYELTYQLRSSLGDMHQVKLPTNTILDYVKIDGLNQPITLTGDSLSVPIAPKAQTISIAFKLNQGHKIWEVVPQIDLQLPSFNHRLEFQLPKNRWLLWVQGPVFGPSVLYWGLLLVAMVAAVVLGKTSLTPLKTYQWVLLFLGLSLASPLMSAFVVLWFILMKQREGIAMDNPHFNTYQLGLGALTAAFLCGLIYSVSKSLVVWPNMLLKHPVIHFAQSSHQYYSSTFYNLIWYQDKVEEGMPEIGVLSFPLIIYKVFVLLWALWLAFSVVKWLVWGWSCFSKGGVWQQNT